MHTPITAIITFILLFVNVGLYAQDGPLRLPADWTGYYQDQEGRLMILEEDFFFLDDLLPKGGYYEKIENTGEDQLKLFFKEYDHQINVPTLSLMRKGKQVEAIYKQFAEVKLLLTPFNPSENTKAVDKDLAAFNGMWYCGKDNLEVSIEFNEVSIGKTAFEISDAFQFFKDNKHFNYYILNSDQGKQMIKNPSQLNDNYISLSMMERNYEHCRKDLNLPKSRSDLYEDLSIDLEGNWVEEGNQENLLTFFDDYTINLDGKRLKISKLEKQIGDGPIRVEYAEGKEDRRMNITVLAEDEIIVIQEKTGKRTVFERPTETKETTDLTGDADHGFLSGLIIGLSIGLLILLAYYLFNRKKGNDFV